MLSIEALRRYGANVDEALARCFQNEAFYLRLVGMIVQDTNLEKLKEALAAGDTDKAFEAAHALKGVLANLALTPVLTPVSEITELLRARTQTDYAPLLADIEARYAELMEIVRS